MTQAIKGDVAVIGAGLLAFRLPCGSDVKATRFYSSSAMLLPRARRLAMRERWRRMA